jgi:hypothetical protein
MFDWLIVGGGIHGTHLSYYLTYRLGVSVDRVRVLDPSPEPLVLWNTMTRNVGMEYLRSPHVHNLSFDPFSLVTFSRTRDGEPNARFIPTFSRPSLKLFTTHSQQLIERYHLRDMRLVGRAQQLEKIENGWRVSTDDGAIEARRVILAIGATEQPLWTDWALRLRETGSSIYHVFETDFHRDQLPLWSNAVVIGGGITAAQLAMSLAGQQRGTVTLLMRHPIREHSFDSDPCWVTSICLKDFHAENDPNRRREIIKQARHKGSMPADVAKDLRFAVAQGLLRVSIGEVNDARSLDQTHVCLDTSLGVMKSDCVILATGFEAKRPGGAWLDYAVAEYEFPVADCGFPIVDKTLQWHEGLYVTGPLAELEIGPTSRNIIGARLASERLNNVI